MADQLQTLAESYVQCVTNIKSSGAAPDLRKRQKEIQDEIARVMVEQKMSYIQVGSKYIVIKPKYKKPTLNAEFIAKAYYQFQSNPENITGRSPEDVAQAFGNGVINARTNLASKEPTIAITDVVPLAARITQGFPI